MMNSTTRKRVSSNTRSSRPQQFDSGGSEGHRSRGSGSPGRGQLQQQSGAHESRNRGGARRSNEDDASDAEDTGPGGAGDADSGYREHRRVDSDET